MTHEITDCDQEFFTAKSAHKPVKSKPNHRSKPVSRLSFVKVPTGYYTLIAGSIVLNPQ
jgi:hypothetical protein